MRNQPPTMIALPTEILVEIFNLVDGTDLSTARLVCKEFCDAITPRFALVNFTERMHVVSPYSIDALVEITEHPVFGGYVKTVAICSARRTNITKSTGLFRARTFEESDQKAYLNAYVKTRRFARRMERVFSNIRSRSGSVTISIHDRPSTNTLNRKRCYGWSRLSSVSNSTLIAYRIVETLEETVYAARRVGCRIECLDIDISISHHRSLEEDLRKAIHEILRSSLTPLSIGLGDRRSQLSYDNELQYLKLQDVDFDRRRHLTFLLPMYASRDWLLNKRVKSLKIARIEDYKITKFQPFLAPRLSSLELHRVSVYTSHFGHDFWSEHIQVISELSGLEYCGFSRLSYTFEWDYDEDINQYFMELPGHGQYPCWSDTFYLNFRDGGDSIEIRDGDICEKLKELACCVAAAEAQKVQTIIRDGCVKNHMVGIFGGV